MFFYLGNIQFWEIFQVETLFQKLWPLLYKGAQLDLRSTKCFVWLTVRKLNECLPEVKDFPKNEILQKA